MPITICHHDRHDRIFNTVKLLTDSLQEISGYINSCKKYQADYFTVISKDSVIRISFDVHYGNNAPYVAYIAHTRINPR